MSKSPSTNIKAGNFLSSISEDNLIANYEYSGGIIVYRGLSHPGAADSDASWQITKYTNDGTNVTSKRYASGTQAYDKVWNSRAGYTYS